MIAWWESLTWLERLFAYVAVPATLLLILQTLLLLFGLGHDGETDVDGPDGDGVPDDLDLDGDFDADGDADGVFDPSVGQEAMDAPLHHEGPFAGLKLFTLRGVVAFLAVAGWGGLWLLNLGLNPWAAVFLAIAMGFWAMLLMALFLRVALHLQSDGTMDLHNALGCAGTVYLTVPAKRAAVGKVNVLFQDQLRELEAVTDEPEHLVTGTEIVVVGISGGSTLVVCRK